MSKKIVISLVSEQRGGLEESFVYYANLAKKAGYEVTALTPFNAPFLNKLHPEIERITFFPRGYYDLFNLFNLVIKLLLISPDILIGFNSRSVHYLTLAAHFVKTPTIAFSGSDKLSKLKRADKIVCNSTKMKDAFSLQGYPENDLIYLPAFGIDLEDLSIQKKSLRTDRNESKVRVGFIGRMTAEKGLLRLINACHDSRLRSIVQLVVAGDGQERDLAETTARKLDIHVDFRGWVNKADFYSGIDLLVVPSLSETFGIVIVEAMAAGVPVVSTPTQGPSMLIDDGKSGWLTEHFTSSSLADKLIEVINNQTSWDDISAGAIQGLESYSTATVIREFTKLIEAQC